jgi:predicted transcriptional regulator
VRHQKCSWLIHFDILDACCPKLVNVSTVLVNCKIKILAAKKFVLELRTSSVRFKTKTCSGLYKVTFTDLIDSYLEIHTVYDNWHQHLYHENRRDHFD